MRIEHVLIGVAIFLLVFTLGNNLYVNQIDSYDTEDNTDKWDGVTRNLSVDDRIVSLRENTEQQEISTDDTESSMFKSNVPAIRDITNAIPLVTKTLNNINKETGLIPEFIGNALVWIISILGLVFVIYMIARFKPQD